MKIEIIQDKHLDMLQEFCNTCNDLGYENNSSFRAMKLIWCKMQGEYWCAIKDNKIIAVAGCHPLTEVSSNAWRIMFRGCELPGNDTFKGLGKGDWNSITQREFIPLMIEHIPSDELYITTNTTHEHSNGKAARNHRLMGLLAKQGILDNYGDCVLYYTQQTLWRLNIEEYKKRRERIIGKYVVES
jgi:hypothetical protein